MKVDSEDKMSIDDVTAKLKEETRNGTIYEVSELLKVREPETYWHGGIVDRDSPSILSLTTILKSIKLYM